MRKKPTSLSNTAGSEWCTHTSKVLGCCCHLGGKPGNSIHCFHYTYLFQYTLFPLHTSIPYRVLQQLNSSNISVQVMAVKEYQANVFENWLYIVWLRMTLIFNLHTANQTLYVTVYVTVQFLALRGNAYGHFPRNQWWSVTEANPISGVCLMVESTRLTTPPPIAFVTWTVTWTDVQVRLSPALLASLSPAAAQAHHTTPLSSPPHLACAGWQFKCKSPGVSLSSSVQIWYSWLCRPCEAQWEAHLYSNTWICWEEIQKSNSSPLWSETQRLGYRGTPGLGYGSKLFYKGSKTGTSLPVAIHWAPRDIR